jgi:hypothetical protein
MPSSPLPIEAHDLFNPLMVMVVTYTAAVVVGQRRYR